MEHIFEFVKMHHDWQQHMCNRCGCMMIIKPDGSSWYMPRGKLRWNPFSRLKSDEPKCFLHARSPMNK